MTDNTITQLKQMLHVNTPIIFIQDYDFVRADELIRNALGNITGIKEWNPANGLINFNINDKQPVGIGNKNNLSDILAEYSNRPKVKKTQFLILRDIQDYLDDRKSSYDPSIKTSLQLLALRKLYDRDFDLTIIIISSVLRIPSEIEKYVSILKPAFPNDDDIKKIIEEHIEENNYNKALFTEKDLQELMPSLRGLTPFEIDRMLDIAMSRNGTLKSEDKKRILEHKKQMVKKSGVLDLIESNDDIKDIGGLYELKEYLKRKSEIIKNLEDAMQHKVAVPKGVFIVGMPGCGKSLCAKATATLFNVPLLKMDMGSLMDKYVGQSEENLRKAIDIAQAAAPCVLWIDEIEKMFSGIGGHNDILTRMFGYFLSWLQDKTSSVYVVATANNADNLPPELKRKGRFDEMFCVNLPEDDERKEIFMAHLKKRGQNHINIDSKDKLITKTKGFNGADIESVINEALEQCYLNGKQKLNLEILLKIANDTIPINKSCKEQIKKMKEIFDTCEFKDASKKVQSKKE